MVQKIFILTFFLLLNCNILESTGLLDSKKEDDQTILYALLAVSLASSIPDTEISGNVRKANGQIITQPSLNISKGTISGNTKNVEESANLYPINELNQDKNSILTTKGINVDTSGAFKFQIQSGDILCVVTDAGVELGMFSFLVTNSDSASTISNRKAQCNLYLKYSSKKLGSTTSSSGSSGENPSDPAETP